MDHVKGPGRQSQKARETRRRIIQAAVELFQEHGYGATNLKTVASRAGVAVQTVYFVFGNKRTLLKELVDVAIAGDDEPVATMNRPWFTDALAAPDAPSMLRAYVAGTTSIVERVAPIGRMLRAAAAGDPEVAAMWAAEVDPRYVVHRHAAEVLSRKPGARAGMPAGEMADLLYGLLSPELYLVLVGERGWTRDHWERWAGDTLGAQLCGGGRRGGPAPVPED